MKATPPRVVPFSFPGIHTRAEAAPRDPGTWVRGKHRPLQTAPHPRPVPLPRGPVPRGHMWGRIETGQRWEGGPPGLDCTPRLPPRRPARLPGAIVRLDTGQGRGGAERRVRVCIWLLSARWFASLPSEAPGNLATCLETCARPAGESALLETDSRPHPPRSRGAHGVAGPSGACLQGLVDICHA